MLSFTCAQATKLFALWLITQQFMFPFWISFYVKEGSPFRFLKILWDSFIWRKQWSYCQTLLSFMWLIWAFSTSLFCWSVNCTLNKFLCLFHLQSLLYRWRSSSSIFCKEIIKSLSLHGPLKKKNFASLPPNGIQLYNTKTFCLQSSLFHCLSKFLF